jgi:hypothetical protein
MTCQPCECVKSGDPCQLTAECEENLFCNNKRVCASAGDGAAGESCDSTADCEKGLVCSVVGLARVCAELGDSDVGEACETTSDCLAGLTCADVTIPGEESEEGEAQLQCTSSPSPVDLVLPGLWKGVECEEGEGTPTAYFEVPKENEELADFYRLPFPNDIRRTASGIDLSGHPVPPTQFAPLIDRVITATAEDVSGFSTTPVVIFRFSEYFRENEDNGITRTIGLRQYEPAAGRDGHFVATEVDAAHNDVTRFLLRALAGQSPQIGE